LSLIILLDASPLMDAVGPVGDVASDGVRLWISTMRTSGARVLVPDLADYEVRRYLLAGLVKSPASKPGDKLSRLDELRRDCEVLTISSAAMLKAAEFWAHLRTLPVPAPTADREKLDADAILAGMAATVGGSDDRVVVATDNPRHIGRYPGVEAKHWETIFPQIPGATPGSPAAPAPPRSST
jgi:hypothetical protein